MVFWRVLCVRSLSIPPNLYFSMNPYSVPLFTPKNSHMYFLGIPLNNESMQIALFLNFKGFCKIQLYNSSTSCLGSSDLNSFSKSCKSKTPWITFRNHKFQDFNVDSETGLLNLLYLLLLNLPLLQKTYSINSLAVFFSSSKKSF